jgi:hypothetical protein
MADFSDQKRLVKYECKLCDYITCYKSNFNRHIKTNRHICLQNAYDKYQKRLTLYICEKCKKEYKHRQSYFRHKKNCFCYHDQNAQNVQKSKNVQNEIIEYSNKEFSSTKELHSIIKKQSEQIDELTTILKDVVPKIGNNVTNNNNIIVNNKMTLNMYLNEECKDAMNLSDFLNQLRITEDDLHYTRKNGYVKGMTNIFEKNLLKMDSNKRPLHCSDQKRLQFYVKDEDKWDKDKELEALNHTLSEITTKNINQLRIWKMKNPNWSEDDQLHDQFIDITRNILYGSLNNVGEKAKKKIIKMLAERTKLDF